MIIDAHFHIIPPIGRGYGGGDTKLHQIYEWEAEQPAQLERLERSILEQGNKGLYFRTEPVPLGHNYLLADDARLEPLWRKVQELKISVWWYLHSGRHSSVQQNQLTRAFGQPNCA